MATITAALVNELRKMTDAPMMDCKRALTACEGNLEKAVEELRKMGVAKAARKSDRVAAEGAAMVATSADGKSAILIELNCETDFVKKNDAFMEFGKAVAEQALNAGIADINQIAQLPYQPGSAETVDQVRQTLIAKLGENIQLRRATFLTAPEGVIGSYVHGNRIGVLVKLNHSTDAELAKDIAMHIAASNPLVISADEVPAEIIEKEKEIFSAQAQQSGKPADIIARMVQGRIDKYVQEVSLLGQPFLKDNSITVEQLVKKSNAQVTQFVRFVVGEGIEKEVVDFATEVMQQVKANSDRD